MKLTIILLVIFVFMIVIMNICVFKISNNFKKIKKMEKFIAMKRNEKEEKEIPYQPIDKNFKNTKFSLNCYPSVYSNDRGCACLTNEEETLFNKRGNNRTGESINNTSFYEI